MLIIDWQADATRCLKVGLNRLTEIIPVAETEEDGKVIYAIAGAMKVVGELKLASDALTDPIVTADEQTKLLNAANSRQD